MPPHTAIFRQIALAFCFRAFILSATWVFPPAVSKQIQNVFEDEESQENATISKMEIVQLEGNREVSREVTHYNLEMLIALAFCFSAFIVRTTWFFQESRSGWTPHPIRFDGHPEMGLG